LPLGRKNKQDILAVVRVGCPGCNVSWSCVNIARLDASKAPRLTKAGGNEHKQNEVLEWHVLCARVVSRVGYRSVRIVWVSRQGYGNGCGSQDKQNAE